MAYGAMRQVQAGCDNRSRCPMRQPAAITANTAPTNSNCPISTPTLKNSKAIGIDDCGKPTSASAPAKPNPCISPNVRDTTHGRAGRDPGPAPVHLDDLARDKENAQRYARLDRRLRDVDPAEGCR